MATFLASMELLLLCGKYFTKTLPYKYHIPHTYVVLIYHVGEGKKMALN